MFTPREPITVKGFTYKFGTRILIRKEDYTPAETNRHITGHTV